MKAYVVVPLRQRARMRLDRVIRRQELRSLVTPKLNGVEWNRDRRFWTFARSRANDVIEALSLAGFNIDYHVEARVGHEKCDKRCRNAASYECHCSCGGVYHQVEQYGSPWVSVGESTLIAPGENVWNSRTIEARKGES